MVGKTLIKISSHGTTKTEISPKKDSQDPGAWSHGKERGNFFQSANIKLTAAHTAFKQYRAMIKRAQSIIISCSKENFHFVTKSKKTDRPPRG